MRAPLRTPSRASPAAPPLRQRRKDARPHELVDAALEVFVEHGYPRATTEDVAARAGVSKGTLYLYFPSKDALLEAVIRHCLSVPVHLEQAMHDERPAATILRDDLATWWIDWYDSRRSGVFKLIFAEARSKPDVAAVYMREVVDSTRATIGALIERGIARGEFRAVDVTSTVRSIVMPMVMLCVHKHTIGASCGAIGRAEVQRFVDHHLELILRGLRPDAADGGPVRAHGAGVDGARARGPSAPTNTSAKRTRNTAEPQSRS
jgi:AcrR family transcriptional regulator